MSEESARRRGIGKTTLSEEIENRFIGQRQRSAKQASAAIRFDFAESAAFDIESYILQLRAGLGHLATSWPAFDVAFSAYWERAHPGEPLREFIDQDSVLRRATRSIGLTEQISSTLLDIAGLALPGGPQAAQVLGGLLYGKAKEAVVRNRMLSKCELLGDLLDADADFETLSYFPYLLAWDLDRLAPRQVKAIVLFDTFEEVTSRRTRDVERWLQRSVFLMPNVLFVITGRNRIDWADLTRTDELDFVGEQRWPYLKAGHVGDEPRQHLVGYLSPGDANSYLAAALTKDNNPVMSTRIRERIVVASAGLPLYLDLAVTIYLDILARGETPTEDDFGQPLPAVAAQLLRDLDQDERDLMRAAALLEAFDLEALKAACPRVPDAAIRRFRGRPFLEYDPERIWHYSLHTILRDAIRHADSDLRDSWSTRERADAAARVVEHLKTLAASAGSSGDRSSHVAALRQAIHLCLLTDQFFDWLVDGVQRLLTTGGWSLLADLPNTGSGPGSALLVGVQGAKERRSGRLDSSIALMNEALDWPNLPQKLRRFLLLHRAHALRVAGQYRDAGADYLILRQTPGDFNSDAGYWLADHDFLQGRFGQVLSALDELPRETADLNGEILRLRGHVYRVNALFDRAEASYREALELARDTTNIGAEGKALTDLVQTLAWCRPADALDIRGRALEVNEAVRNLVEIVKIYAATAVALTGVGRLDEADSEIERGLTLTHECGYPGGLVWCWVARTFNRVTRFGTDEGRTAAAQVAAIVDDLQGNRFWSEITEWWTDVDNDHNDHWDSNTDWIGGDGAAKARWSAVYSANQDHET